MAVLGCVATDGGHARLGLRVLGRQTLWQSNGRWTQGAVGLGASKEPEEE